MNQKILSVLLICAVLLTGCKEKAAPVQQTSGAAGLAKPVTGQTTDYISNSLSISFSYPSDWRVEEDNNTIVLTSPSGQNNAIMIADISYEVSLFLAGHGDMEDSIDALIDKYSDFLAGDAYKDNYQYEWGQNDGDIRAQAGFTYQDGGNSYQGFVDIEQIGSRVFLSAHISPANSQSSDILNIYNALNASFSAGGTDGELEPANLTDLGFPEAPSGFYRFYSPVTGQFFFYPNDWTLINNVHDDCVILVNEKGALMLSENRTDKFYESYNSNGSDEVECFDEFLEECAQSLEIIYGETPRYHDFKYMSTKNRELIKATFNYTVSSGTGRCFAEFGVRPMNGTDYIQATLCLYKVGDSYSIDVFSIIMDSTLIFYPEL